MKRWTLLPAPRRRGALAFALGWQAQLWLFLAMSLALPQKAQAGAAFTSCSSISVTDVVFSDYDTVTKPQLETTGTVTVTCIANGTGNVNLTISLGAGLSGSCTQRDMYNGSNTEKYSLFHASNYSGSWCGNYNQPTTVSVANTPQTYTYTIYAQVPSGQNLAFGNFSDTVTASTVTSGTDASTSFLVTDHVPGVCSLAATALSFGTYATAQLDGTATLTVNCSNTAAYSVSLGGGNNLSGATRRMAGPSGQYLNYGLYSDSARSTAWGDGTGLGATVAGTGTGVNQTLSVYGRIPSGQFSTPGSYSDTVIVTLNY